MNYDHSTFSELDKVEPRCRAQGGGSLMSVELDQARKNYAAAKRRTDRAAARFDASLTKLEQAKSDERDALAELQDQQEAAGLTKLERPR